MALHLSPEEGGHQSSLPSSSNPSACASLSTPPSADILWHALQEAGFHGVHPRDLLDCSCASCAGGGHWDDRPDGGHRSGREQDREVGPCRGGKTPDQATPPPCEREPSCSPPVTSGMDTQSSQIWRQLPRVQSESPPATSSQQGKRLREPPVSLGDGHHWRKYGRKRLKETNAVRSYYRCCKREETGCLTKFYCDQGNDQSILATIVFQGEHNHSPAQTSENLPLPVAGVQGGEFSPHLAIESFQQLEQMLMWDD